MSRQIHRAVVLIAMMVLAVGALALLIADAGGKSLIALVVVIVVAAIGGIAFSWKRYFRPPVKPGSTGRAEQLRAGASSAEGAASTGPERTNMVREDRSESGNARMSRPS